MKVVATNIHFASAKGVLFTIEIFFTNKQLSFYEMTPIP